MRMTKKGAYQFGADLMNNLEKVLHYFATNPSLMAIKAVVSVF